MEEQVFFLRGILKITEFMLIFENNTTKLVLAAGFWISSAKQPLD